jgi:thymidylate synthase (FAD)
MKILEPSARILTPIAHIQPSIELLEFAGRTCYKTEGKCSPGSAGPFVHKIANTFKHESVIEHASISVLFVCDRGVSHELVRHRLGAYSQESTRYCNYSKEQFGREITVIKPLWWNPDDLATQAKYFSWKLAMQNAEASYFALIDAGATPQEARSVLPNSLKTEVIATFNLRQWRHVFKMRCSSKAHPQMQQVMKPLQAEFAKLIPELFGEIQTQET